MAIEVTNFYKQIRSAREKEGGEERWRGREKIRVENAFFFYYKTFFFPI